MWRAASPAAGACCGRGWWPTPRASTGQQAEVRGVSIEEVSRYISPEERRMIQDSQGSATRTKSLKVPWMKMFTSVPFLALILSHFCNNFGW